MKKIKDLAVALGVVILIILVEYFFRRYVIFWLPQIGSYRVNDMLVLLLAYALILGGLGLALHTNWRQEWAGLRATVPGFFTTRAHIGWLVAMIVVIAALPMVDQLLWGDVELPLFTSSYRNPNVWLMGQEPLLKIVFVIAVNGIFVPVAEEFLWRGLVQVRLLRVMPVPLAIGATAVLFSVKHVLVDASLDRFLMVFAFGLITGILAYRESWHSSAILHVYINTVSSIRLLLMEMV